MNDKPNNGRIADRIHEAIAKLEDDNQRLTGALGQAHEMIRKLDDDVAKCNSEIKRQREMLDNEVAVRRQLETLIGKIDELIRGAG